MFQVCSFAPVPAVVLDARPARSKLPSTNSKAGLYRSSWVQISSTASWSSWKSKLHSPELPIHISTGFNLSGTRSSGKPLVSVAEEGAAYASNELNEIVTVESGRSEGIESRESEGAQ